MLSISIPIPAGVNTLGTAVALTNFAFATSVTIQLPHSSSASDAVDFYVGNISNATSIDELEKVPNLSIPNTGESTNDQPTQAATVPYLYIYAYRRAGDSGAINATLVGATEPTNGGGSVPNAILQGGNAFGAPIHIGPTDGQDLVLGNFAGASTTNVVLDTTGAGSISVATGAAAKTVTLGSTTGASSLTAQSGTGGVSVMTATTGNITIQSGTTGTVTLDSGTTGDVNLGTGANAKRIIIGNVTGATSVTVNAGTGNIDIGTTAQARSINVGTGAADQTVTVGSTNTTSTTVMRSGSGGIAITTSSAGNMALVADQTGACSVQVDAGTSGIAIGGNAVAQAITVGTGAAAKTVSVGSTNSTSSLTLSAGTGTISIGASASARTVNIATGAAAQAVTVGSTNTTSSLTLAAGTGLILLSGAVRCSTVAAPDSPGDGTIGNGLTAAQTVDIASAFTVNQTTAGRTLTLPAPTTVTATHLALVMNIGTQSFTMYGKTITVAATPQTSGAFFLWNGSAWVGTA